MTKQLLYRTSLFICLFWTFSITHQAAVALGTLFYSMQLGALVVTTPVRANKAPDSESRQIGNMAKGHHFLLVAEETVHIYDFCLDKIRRRCRIISFILCACTKIFLTVIHLSIIACHVDHLLNHGFHYLLKMLL